METRLTIPADLLAAELRVDTHSLTRFGEFVQRELHENIAPMAGRVSPALNNGSVVAPRLASGDIEAMNSAHVDCITAMRSQLQSYLANMAIIADAARAVAARYTSSDALAGATINGIVPDFSAAATRDTPPQPDTPHGGYI